MSQFRNGYQFMSKVDKKGKKASEGGAIAKFECYSSITNQPLKRYVHESDAIKFCDWSNESRKERPQDYHPNEIIKYKTL
jgi:hypothetical protein